MYITNEGFNTSIKIQNFGGASFNIEVTKPFQSPPSPNVTHMGIHRWLTKPYTKDLLCQCLTNQL